MWTVETLPLSSNVCFQFKAIAGMRCSTLRPGGVVSSTLTAIAAGTWTMVLLQVSEQSALSLSRPGVYRLAAVRGGLAGGLTLNVKYAWQRWRGLVNGLAGLVAQRAVFVGFTSPQFNLLSEALAWHTWVGSTLHWLFLVGLLRQGLAGQVQALTCLPSQVCLVLTSPWVSTHLVSRLVQSSLPLIGLSGPSTRPGLFWISGWAGYSYGFEVEFLFLNSVWIVATLFS